MSDQEVKHTDQSGERSEAVVAATKDRVSGGRAPMVTGPASAPRKASSGIAWLALLLVIVLAGGTVWALREGQNREAAIAKRLAELETRSVQKQSTLDELEDRLQKQLRTDVGKLDESTTEQTSNLSAQLQSVEMQLAEQQKELARFSASDRDSWLLAEAGHLLRLANQRLVMAGDPVAAQALLNSADAVLRELDDPGLHSVRAAVAADVAALRAVGKVDIEGIYLRLAALIEQAEKLVIFQFPEITPAPTPDAAADWQGRLRQGYESALSKLSDYIIIRRRDVPMKALMDPQWEGLVRQNLRMLLEQAQVALLSGNQALYNASLERAQHWVAQFQESDTAAASAISAQIAQLAQLTIEVPQPDISRSQRALDDAVEQRLQAAGGIE
ncbi:MAG: uroporphyrinogen-III C-methyltransferase [Halioglobus sp.]